MKQFDKENEYNSTRMPVKFHHQNYTFCFTDLFNDRFAPAIRVHVTFHRAYLNFNA